MRPWPLWRKILAYSLLTALALLSIWLVDRKAHRLPNEPVHRGTPPGNA